MADSSGASAAGIGSTGSCIVVVVDTEKGSSDTVVLEGKTDPGH